MTRTAFRTGALTMVLLCLCAGAAVAEEVAPEVADAVQVTDRDRMWVNFSREAAVLGANHWWAELRGMKLNSVNDPALGLSGYPVTPLAKKKCPNNAPGDACIESIDGGRFDLIGAYGLGPAAEFGIDIPFVVQQQIEFTNGSSQENATMGDLQLYGKFKQELAEHWAGAIGLELSAPTGSSSKLTGSGNLGLNPFLSTRYQSGRIGFGGHLGFLLNTGNQSDVFNWSLEGVARATSMLALRTEINGRLLRDGGTINDISIWPGLDFDLTDYFVIRPEGLVHASDDAISWGIGIGFAVTM